MAINRRTLKCTPEAVFRVLADGWLYPSWVVGTARMRDVDEEWPAPEARLHHSVGTWPMLVDGTTSVVQWNPPHRAVLKAHGWLIGTARVVIEVTPSDGGALVELHEEPVSGPTLLLPGPVVDLMLWRRNTEALQRLAFLCEGMNDPV
jgi:hypothetical protein